MKKRQGNDLGIIWKINHQESNPIERSVMQQVYIVHRRMRTRFAPVFVLEGDTIKCTYPAPNQELGVYDLFVTFAFPDETIPGGLGTCTVDLENAFEIVPRTAQEDTANSVITLQSELLLALHGKSAYEIALKYGETKTEQEWVKSLKMQFSDLTTEEIRILQEPATSAANMIDQKVSESIEASLVNTNNQISKLKQKLCTVDCLSSQRVTTHIPGNDGHSVLCDNSGIYRVAFDRIDLFEGGKNVAMYEKYDDTGEGARITSLDIPIPSWALDNLCIFSGIDSYIEYELCTEADGWTGFYYFDNWTNGVYNPVELPAGCTHIRLTVEKSFACGTRGLGVVLCGDQNFENGMIYRCKNSLYNPIGRISAPVRVIKRSLTASCVYDASGLPTITVSSIPLEAPKLVHPGMRHFIFTVLKFNDTDRLIDIFDGPVDVYLRKRVRRRYGGSKSNAYRLNFRYSVYGEGIVPSYGLNDPGYLHGKLYKLAYKKRHLNFNAEGYAKIYMDMKVYRFSRRKRSERTPLLLRAIGTLYTPDPSGPNEKKQMSIEKIVRIQKMG